MFELKTNEEIGNYLKKLILSNYTSCRQFCVAYIKLQDYDDDAEEIRKMTNRLSQILNGKKSIQTYDLPIFSELLGVSCEEMLSAGDVRKPITNRRTNYNIAFSHNESDWIDYLNREDCIAAYADEFGKTVVDYAIEFKNYGFLKFLMDNDYIKFVSEQDDWYHGYGNFGAKSLIKNRPYELVSEFYDNKLLRTKLIAVALESEDDSILEELRARELPIQYAVTEYHYSMVKFEEFYDESFIDVILNAKDTVFDYFCQEYEITSLQAKNYHTKWIYPFFSRMIERGIKINSSRVHKMLDIAINHNANIFYSLKKEMLRILKEQKQSYYREQGITELLQMIIRDFHINEEKNYVSFYAYWCKANPIAGLILYVNSKSNDNQIQDKVNQLNDLYDKIVNIKKYLIKQ